MKAKSWFPISSLGRQDGFVLPTVIFALVIIGVLLVGGILISNDEARSERSFRETALALYAADAGWRNIQGSWPTAAVEALNPGDSLVTASGWVTLPDRATYRVVIYRVDNGGLQQYLVMSQGRRPSQIGGQSTITGTVTGLSPFQWGIFTKGNMSLTGSSYIDAYNSANGVYGGANIDNTAGSVAGNGNLTTGSGAVHGNATVAGTVSGNVTGTVTTGVSPIAVPPNLACPSGGYTPSASVPSGSGISYNAATGVLQVNGGHSLTLTYPAGGAFYFHAVVLTGGSTLTITSGGAHVDVYIDSLLNVSGGGVVNTSATPTTLDLAACGSPASPQVWTLSGGSGAYYTVFAPNHDLSFTGGSVIYGALVGKSLIASGGSSVHYDKALANSRGTKLVPVSGSWSQVSAF